MRALRVIILILVCMSMLLVSGCWSYISKESNVRFMSRKSAFTVTVYPVSVVTGNLREGDEKLAKEVIDFLAEEGLALPVKGEGEIDLPVKWGMNQAKMAKKSALGFSEIMQAKQIDTEYSLLVEILCDTGETKVGGVHYYLCDSDGYLADGGLTNSHWDEFHVVNPVDRNGGVEVAKLMLKKGFDLNRNK